METKLQKIGEVGTLLFPAWVLIGSILSFFFPQWFTWFTGPAITYGLGFTMLGMGITLLPRDFRNIFKTPISVFIGVALQYTVMPVSGWGIGVLLDLPIPLATGLVVVSCCPGGVASNVITYLAKGDLALSVSMTASSTILSVFMTPLLTTFFDRKRNRCIYKRVIFGYVSGSHSSDSFGSFIECLFSRSF